MKCPTWIRRALATSAMVVLLGSLLSSPATVLAAAPTNDDFANATAISAFPFSDVTDNTEATAESGEPTGCANSPHSVWYSITPAVQSNFRADMTGSEFSDTVLMVYSASGPGFGGLSFVGCSTFGGGPVTWNAQAGTTYYIQAGDFFSGGGSLHVNVQLLPPPPNDAFVDATTIDALPFNETVDASAATSEPGEPFPSDCVGAAQPTVWYAFTPSTSQTVSASAGRDGFLNLVIVYTGGSLATLHQQACGVGGTTFLAEAGTTYYMQIISSGEFQFKLDLAPPPEASFFSSPGDPSIFDTIQFSDNSFDPGGVGIESTTWTFGDGATANGCCPTHRYATDGDYTTQLTATTFDGRSGSTSQVVHVSTHDVAITTMNAPSTAKSGQTQQIRVNVNNQRYPETVEVQLFKSVPAGLELVGTLSQSVPKRSRSQTTEFAFTYTFTSADATLGKVTFQATATISGARDALPADNSAIAPATKVKR